MNKIILYLMLLSFSWGIENCSLLLASMSRALLYRRTPAITTPVPIPLHMVTGFPNSKTDNQIKNALLVVLATLKNKKYHINVSFHVSSLRRFEKVSVTTKVQAFQKNERGTPVVVLFQSSHKILSPLHYGLKGRHYSSKRNEDPTMTYIKAQTQIIIITVTCPCGVGHNKRIAPTYSLRVVKGD